MSTRLCAHSTAAVRCIPGLSSMATMRPSAALSRLASRVLPFDAPYSLSARHRPTRCVFVSASSSPSHYFSSSAATSPLPTSSSVRSDSGARSDEEGHTSSMVSALPPFTSHLTTSHHAPPITHPLSPVSRIGTVQRPSVLVSELDRFIVGQSEAKRAVAVALRQKRITHRLVPLHPLPLFSQQCRAGCHCAVQATVGVVIDCGLNCGAK